MKLQLDGHEVYVSRGGTTWDRARPTMVMTHGAGMDHSIWVLLGRYFARHGYNLVAPDLPGHGMSGGELLDSIGAMAQWQQRLLDTLAEEHDVRRDRVVWCGHSMGALVALQSAANEPQTAASLVLLGSGYPMPVGDALMQAAKHNDHAAIDMIALFGHSLASQLGHNAIAGISVYQSAIALLEQAKDGVLANDLAACNAYADGDSAAATLAAHDVPVLSVAGDQDRMTPLKMARSLAEAANGELVVLTGCGHMSLSEAPEQTLQALRKRLLPPLS